MSEVEFKTFLEHCRARVDRVLEQQLPNPPESGNSLIDAMRYSLLSGGKRVRPVLAYAAAQTFGVITPATDAVACSLEAIHAYSLIHDDLPAMDDDELRRGQATCHIAFDEATAILAGDALQTLAFEALTDAPDLDAETRLKLVSLLTRASGAQGMVLGQAIDLEAVDHTLSLAQLEQMHGLKTGALIEASVLMGAVASGQATSVQLEALSQYARAIGLAFQVQDDILDVTADTDTLGKPQGSDLASNKPTYVSLLGLEAAREKALELHQNALQALAVFGPSADHLRALSAYIVQRGH